MLLRHVRGQIRGSWACKSNLDFALCQISIMHECQNMGMVGMIFSEILGTCVYTLNTGGSHLKMV